MFKNRSILLFHIHKQIDTVRILAMPTTTAASEFINHSHDGEKYAEGVNWDTLGFGLTPIDFMYTMKCTDGENFTNGQISPFKKMELCPSAGILNYGQGLFEGLKAIRTEDGRRVLLFRPKENAQRMKIGAERMCMPSPSIEQFVDAVKEMVLANRRWVPPPGKGALYLRPLLMGTSSNLGLGPAREYTFIIFASPVGCYYHKGALNVYVEHKLHRATPGGTGGVKSVTNYSPVYQPLKQVKAKGFSDILFLDSLTGKNIEELAGANIFILKGNVISTPTLIHGTILPGVTRKSIIDIALHFGYKVEEREIPVEDLLEADEAFCTGTAVVVTPIGAVTYDDKRAEYKTGEGTLCKKMYETLTGIQTGRLEDKKEWTVEVK